VKTLSLTLGLGLLACGTATRVNYDYDQSYDFTGLKRWDWMADPAQGGAAAVARSPLVDARIRAAIERELAAKGYARDEGAGDVDFHVAFLGGTDEKVDLTTTYYGYRWRVPVTEARQYTEGTLIVDVVDAERNELVWRGTGAAEVHAGDPDEVTKQVDQVVMEILKDFPPPGP
jgi:hypothetical protein